MKLNLKENTPNLDKLARDSRLGTMPVSLKVKNKTYAILQKAADDNNTSVGSIINELLNNYVEADLNYLYQVDEKENAKQLIKRRLQKLGQRLYNFSDIELSAYICEQSKEGLIDTQPFETPSDVDACINGDYDADLYLNTTSAPIIDFGGEASFDANMSSVDDDCITFPIYIISLKKECAKIVLPLLLAFVDDYDKFVAKKECYVYPCIVEHQYRELVTIMNKSLDKKQIIDATVEVLCHGL